MAGFKTMYRRFAEAAPLHQGLTTDDVGQAAVFLCSDMASRTTGQVLFVDSGYNIMGITETIET